MVFIFSTLIFQQRNPRPKHACRPHAALGRCAKDGHVKDGALDGSANVLVLFIAIFLRHVFLEHRWSRPAEP